jgi:hypothetical protein
VCTAISFATIHLYLKYMKIIAREVCELARNVSMNVPLFVN